MKVSPFVNSFQTVKIKIDATYQKKVMIVKNWTVDVLLEENSTRGTNVRTKAEQKKPIKQLKSRTITIV